MSTALPHHLLVVRGPELQAVRDAAAVRAEAREAAAAAYEHERRRGYEDGLREAAEAAARLVGGAEAAASAYWAERERELVPLALAIAHRIVSGLPPDAVLTGIARVAIAEHRQDTTLTLRAAPDAAAALRRCLASDPAAAHVEVQADFSLPPGSCVLSHPRGRTSLGLLDQFRAMLATAAGGP